MAINSQATLSGEGRTILDPLAPSRARSDSTTEVVSSISDIRRPRWDVSTKTTHPVFMARLQALWDELGIRAVLRLPYAAMTKGEMMAECRASTVLADVASEATSCGRFVRNGYKHCGRCVPCLVRRASFIRANLRDDMTYVYPSLRGAQLENEPNDIGAVAVAVLKVEQSGVRLFTAGQLSFAEPSLRREFEGVVQRGLAELGVLLRQEQIL